MIEIRGLVLYSSYLFFSGYGTETPGIVIFSMRFTLSPLSFCDLSSYTNLIVQVPPVLRLWDKGYQGTLVIVCVPVYSGVTLKGLFLNFCAFVKVHQKEKVTSRCPAGRTGVRPWEP